MSSPRSTVLALLLIVSPVFLETPVQAVPADHASLLLHIGPVTAKNPCGAAPTAGTAVVTEAPLVPGGPNGFFVYVLAHHAVAGERKTVAGVQFGITYDGGDGAGIHVDDWHSCGSLEFHQSDWPASGSGNLITWDPVSKCQSGEVVPVGYFYVSVDGPATLALTPRPVDGRAVLANCEAAELDVYPRRLGRVSFGGAMVNGDPDGFNPMLEPPAGTDPIVTFHRPGEFGSVDDDDLDLYWFISDDEPYQANLPLTWRIDGGSWQSQDPARPLKLRDLASGSHTVEGRTVDLSGEEGSGSAQFTTTAPRNLAPVVRLFGTPPANLPGAEGLHLSWTADDDRTPADQVRYRFTMTRRAPGSNSTESMGTPLTDDIGLQLPLLAVGQYRASLSALDDEGDESDEVTIEFQVDSGPNGEYPGVGIISGPLFNEEITDATPTWRAGGYDEESPDAELAWSWRLDGGGWTAFSPVDSHTVALVTAGWHTIEVRSRDGDGLVSWFPDSRRFRLLSVPEGVTPLAAPVGIRLVAPNPSRGPTGFTLDQRSAGPMQADIFDASGRRIRQLVEGDRAAGMLRILWDGQDDGRQPVPSGTYWLRYRSPDGESTARIVIAR